MLRRDETETQRVLTNCLHSHVIYIYIYMYHSGHIAGATYALTQTSIWACRSGNDLYAHAFLSCVLAPYARLGTG